MSKVLIKEATYDNADEVIEQIFNEFPQDWSGKKVLVKPNILSPCPQEKGITTHPSIVKAIVGELEKRDAQIIVGDNPGARGYGINEKCADISGILEASLGYYKNISLNTVEVPIKSRLVDKVVISKDILWADIIISVPKFKTHTLTQMTGGVKNMYGILVGAEKSRLHAIAKTEKNFSEIVVDVYGIKIPSLIIMDAVVGMEGNGPSSKDLRHIGKILASDNAVCLDSVASAMMGIKPEQVKHLQIANKRGLGEIDINNINIIGDLEIIKDFKKPATLLPTFYNWIANNIIFRLIARSKLKVIGEFCQGCGVCADNCPVGAITMQGIPVIDYKKCISCYCCQELCPYQAIEVGGFAGWALKRKGK